MEIYRTLRWALMVLLISGAACTQVGPNQGTESAVPNASPATPPLMPTAAIPLSTATFQPTASVNQEQQTGQLLNNQNCVLPCYLGITPGQTTLNKARDILTTLGANYIGAYQRRTDAKTEHAYELVLGGDAAGEMPRPDGSVVTVYHHISLITDTDVVQIIDVGVGTAGPARPASRRSMCSGDCGPDILSAKSCKNLSGQKRSMSALWIP